MKIKKFNESKEELISVLNQKDATYYVSDGDMIKFITENSDMTWNTVCKFVRENDITGWQGENAYWVKSDLIKDPKSYNPIAVEWLLKFFEAHPWIEQMMLCFDD